MTDFHVCPHGPCAQPLRDAQAALQRLEDLMRRCREDGHQVVYQDLVAVVGLPGGVTACGGHPTGQPTAAADLAEALKDRPEFADCKPAAGVNPSVQPQQEKQR